VNEHHGDASIAELIDSIDSQTALLAWQLVLRTPADRTDPVALEWVRRWGPSRLLETPLECSCAEGRCLVCN
jgi:hypothetical protein